MLLDELLRELGYRQSAFYREDYGSVDISVAHLLRDARRAGVQGTYFVRTGADDRGIERARPAVHVAAADTPEKARSIRKQLWNQGTTPFLLISLPEQVRVYAGFTYDEENDAAGSVTRPLGPNIGAREIAGRLSFLQADKIDSGEIWRLQRNHLVAPQRVDRALLRAIQSLSGELVRRYKLDRQVAHSLIGRFVYLYYLRERNILSDQWLDAVGVAPNAVFSRDATLKGFRYLTDAVEERFNGNIFPIAWNSSSAPNAEAVKYAARVFAGQEPGTGQIPLFRKFDFSFIPVEFISAIYEQFLHDEGNGDKDGAFYTSELVADNLIAEVESVKRLDAGMKVLDPCCGSAIFLVLAYRRLIEQELRRRNVDKLPPSELREILTASIFGVERNPEACLVAEFNLILTLLSYVDPPELHRHKSFEFPTLHNNQVFQCDFFDDESDFWKSGRQFDMVLGNPPWSELDAAKEDDRLAVDWIKRAQASGETPVARFRSSEAFAWRVREKSAHGGVVGLITQATSLTNDQSDGFRRAFFKNNAVHRVTNFANLAYILFESAEEPAADIVYSPHARNASMGEIIHFGPMVAHQPALRPEGSRQKRVPWILNLCESEIQTIPREEAAKGLATTWKRALWGTSRDHRILERLRRALPSSLGTLENERSGWHLSLGLQLRASEGSEEHPNDPQQSLVDLKVLEPRRPAKADSRLTIPDSWLVANTWGTYTREGRKAGVNIVRAPHLFLWNEFAAFSEQDFIFRHPDLGLSAPDSDADWLRAISAIWTSSITAYVLFLELSAGWGISRSTIDLGDAKGMLMPKFDAEKVKLLAQLQRTLADEEAGVTDRSDWQRRLDEGVARILKLPAQAMLVAREFVRYRLPLVKGKFPRSVSQVPDLPQLNAYAHRLKSELDSFLEAAGRRHDVVVTDAPSGIVATIELLRKGLPGTATARASHGKEEEEVRDVLETAARRFSQWIYVRRSVRVFAGNKIELCKPARRLEWTETQALLDAADIIAEVAEERGRRQ